MTKQRWAWHMTSLGVMNGSNQYALEYFLKKINILKWIEIEPGLIVERKYLLRFIIFHGYRKQQEL